MHSSKKSLGLSLGIVFIFYILNILSELSKSVSFLKYFSVYTLADIRNVIKDISINPINVTISIVISILLLFGTYYRYNKKELI